MNLNILSIDSLLPYLLKDFSISNRFLYLKLFFLKIEHKRISLLFDSKSLIKDILDK